jgi:hypothetical protein
MAVLEGSAGMTVLLCWLSKREGPVLGSGEALVS